MRKKKKGRGKKEKKQKRQSCARFAPHTPRASVSLGRGKLTLSCANACVLVTEIMPFPFAGDLDLKAVSFSPVDDSNHKTKVHLTLPGGKKLFFSLCADFQVPMACKYSIDEARPDGDNSRRGQTVVLDDESLKKSLMAFDEAIVKAAVKHSKEWFKSKTALSEEVVRSKYQPIVKVEDDGSCSIKFKVKVPPSKVCTKFVQKDESGKFGAAADPSAVVSELEYRGCRIAPIVSAPFLWFMGGGSKFGVSIQAEEMVVFAGGPTDCLANFASATGYETSTSTASKRNEEAAELDAGGSAAKQTRVELVGDGAPPAAAIVRDD